jgi:hypothetical protein
MSDKPISPLRERMIDDMTARRFKEKVQRDYVRHFKTFSAGRGRSTLSAAHATDQRRVHQRRRLCALLLRRHYFALNCSNNSQ